jgi:glycosyltransferase involved in cell wall biosynthesis
MVATGLPNPGTRPRVAVLFHRFGPYHVSRLSRAAALLDVYGVEMSATDRIYAWNQTHGEGSFPRVVVSHDIDRDGGGFVVRRVGEVLSALSPDVVAVPGWSHRGALAALLWCLRTATPALLMSDSTRRDRRRRGWQEAVKRRIVALFGSAFVAGTRQLDYLVGLGMPAAKIRLGFDVVDNDHFRCGAERARGSAALRASLGLPDHYFLTVCRFVDEKNTLRLIEAYHHYSSLAGERAWRLVILGDGPLRPEMERMIEARGLGGHVILPGFRQYQDLPGYYGLAKALVLPSTMEPWGLVVNEAMAAGLPVLVSEQCGCVDDLVEVGCNGHRFDPLAPGDLARLLMHVASDACDCDALGRQSQAIIAAWSPDRFASGLNNAALLALDRAARGNILDRLLLRVLIERSAVPASEM